MDHYIHRSPWPRQRLPRFSKWALKAIYGHSRGTPRIINNLCDKAMLAAFVRDSDEVTWWDVRAPSKKSPPTFTDWAPPRSTADRTVLPSPTSTDDRPPAPARRPA
ncbi:MAG: hypothetical protein IPL39_02255 [Opitutaceae bacterium]|nr:hypothetical protein [Opitutaceae bacterium]